MSLCETHPTFVSRSTVTRCSHTRAFTRIKMSWPWRLNMTSHSTSIKWSCPKFIFVWVKLWARGHGTSDFRTAFTFFAAKVVFEIPPATLTTLGAKEAKMYKTYLNKLKCQHENKAWEGLKGWQRKVRFRCLWGLPIGVVVMETWTVGRIYLDFQPREKSFFSNKL